MPLLLLFAWSFWFLMRRAPRPVWLFPLALAAAPVLALGLPDVLAGGIWFTVLRYTTPLHLGTELALAYWLGAKLDDSLGLLRREPVSLAVKGGIWPAAVLGIALLGMWSCVLESAAPYSSDATIGRHNREVARALAPARDPLVISDWGGKLLTLSYVVDFGVSVQAMRAAPDPMVAERFGEVLVLAPEAKLLRQLEQSPWRLEPVLGGGELWRLVKPADSDGAGDRGSDLNPR